MEQVIDPIVLEELAQDIGRQATAEFVDRYRGMLDARVGRLASSVASKDTEEAYVAALSLHSSSAMVGATALASLAKQLATAVGELDLAAARAVSSGLPALAARTAAAIGEPLRPVSRPSA